MEGQGNKGSHGWICVQQDGALASSRSQIDSFLNVWVSSLMQGLDIMYAKSNMCIILSQFFLL